MAQLATYVLRRIDKNQRYENNIYALKKARIIKLCTEPSKLYSFDRTAFLILIYLNVKDMGLH